MEMIHVVNLGKDDYFQRNFKKGDRVFLNGQFKKIVHEARPGLLHLTEINDKTPELDPLKGFWIEFNFINNRFGQWEKSSFPY